MIKRMVTSRSSLLPYLICMVVMVAQAEDPYLFFEWNVTYGTLSPMGVPQQVILINNQFPGPNLNTTTNNNIVINVFNYLDEPLLFTWNGVQQRKNSWHDGMPGTNCPILPGTNWTYRFQVKDQIGSMMYYPTTGFQKAAGGFGGLRINSRLLIPVPFPDPEDDYTVLAGDWYKKSHKALRKILDSGKTIGKPNGVLINGKQGTIGDVNEQPQFLMIPGKTYRFRIVQSFFDSFDIHLGQCYSALVTADQEPKDYYMVASTRFTKYTLQTTGIIRYDGGVGPASNILPDPPAGWAWSLNQFRTLRWNLTASAARPNPQGSFHYGQINITRTIKLINTVGTTDGKLRYAINGFSHIDPETPLKLAEYYGIHDQVVKYDPFPDMPGPEVDNVDNIVIQPIVINTTYRNFVEIILENHEKGVQSWHLAGYAFFQFVYL